MSHNLSWGRAQHYEQQVRHLNWKTELPSFDDLDIQALAVGLRRSYGDCCLNAGGLVFDASALNRFLSFDAETGVLHCEAGASIASIIEVFLPRGWFPKVVPGTKYVTVGGAIANDVHGKNHHLVGTFGCHVLEIELLRSDGLRLLCSRSENSEMFYATIGGIGLTGLIVTAKIQLRPVSSTMILAENHKIESIDEFFELTENSDSGFEYTVTWMDASAGGAKLGRGIFMRGQHQEGSAAKLAEYHANHDHKLRLPFELPSILLNPYSMRVFNWAFYNKQFSKVKRLASSYDSYFFPLDVVRDWNLGYGRPGFYQFQCVVPINAADVIVRALEMTSMSFLTVLKKFGDIDSGGLMSFPMPGYTLTLDLPNRGKVTQDIYRRLETMTLEAGGRLYTAKDGLMQGSSFVQMYPNLSEFKKYVDPKFSSSMWREVDSIMSRSVLIVGASALIAQETAKALLARRASQSFVLVGRNADRLSAIAEDLRSRGAVAVDLLVGDLLSSGFHAEIAERAAELDTALLAWGELGNQARAESDPDEAGRLFEVNFTSHMRLLLRLANVFEARKSGMIVEISSVAGDRGRQSNFIYGSAKAALSSFLSGLRNRLCRSGVAVLTVKPGMVRTPMTAHMSGALFADAKEVGLDIARAIEKRRDVIYTPSKWRWIMLIICSIPESLFKRLKL